MAIAITKPSSQIGNTSNIAVYSMAPSFLPTANSRLIVFAHATGTVLGTITGAGGLSWSVIQSMDPQALGSSSRILMADAGGNPSSVAINVDHTGDNATGCGAVALQVTGQEPYIRQIAAVNSVANNPALTFPLAVDSNNAYMIGVVTSQQPVFTAPAGWTTVAASYGTPTTGLFVGYRAGGETASTFVFSTGNVNVLGIFGVELWASGAIPVVDPMGMSGVYGA